MRFLTVTGEGYWVICMTEIRAILLEGTEAKKEGIGIPQNIEVNIRINDVGFSGDELKFKFTYETTYHPKLGYLKIFGTAAVGEKLTIIKSVMDGWKKNKSILPQIMGPLLNAINMTAGLNGVFISRALNMASPFMPPKLEMRGK